MFIGKNYKVESDNLNVILYKKAISKKTGKEPWRVEGYYYSVVNALKALVDFGVRETALKDLRTIISKIDELYALIDQLKCEKEKK